MTRLSGFVDDSPGTPRDIGDDLHFVLNAGTDSLLSDPTSAKTPPARVRYGCVVVGGLPAGTIEPFALISVTGNLQPSSPGDELPRLNVTELELITDPPAVPYLAGEGITVRGSTVTYSCPITGLDQSWTIHGRWLRQARRPF